MFKKKLFLPILIALVVVLAACSPDNGGGPEPDVPADTPPPTGNEVPSDEDIEEPDAEKPDTEEPDTEEPSGENQDGDASVYSNIKIKPEEAFDIYMDKYPDTKVKKLEVDTDMGKYVYKVEGFDGANEYEVKIDPINGDILKEEKDSDDDNEVEISRAHAEKVQALVDKALEEAGADSELEEWTLDTNNGKAMLEVEIDRQGKDDIEHTYDVESGELVEKDD